METKNEETSPQPVTPTTDKPKWYSRQGLNLWTVAAICVAILSTTLLLPRDHPAKLWIFLGTVAVAVAAYFYTHPSKPKNVTE